MINLTDLTPREREVLGLLAQGYSNQMIADAHTTSERTVRHQVYLLTEKLEARNRTHAVVIAMQQGLLSIDSVASDKHYAELAQAIRHLRCEVQRIEQITMDLGSARLGANHDAK